MRIKNVFIVLFIGILLLSIALIVYRSITEEKSIMEVIGIDEGEVCCVVFD